VISQIWSLLIRGLGLSYGLDVWAGHDFPINLALAVFGLTMLWVPHTFPCHGGVDKPSLENWTVPSFGFCKYFGCFCFVVEKAGGFALHMASFLTTVVFTTRCFIISPILYLIAGLGIAIVNDFKSIEGDRAMGLNSHPVAFGVDGAAKICAGSVSFTQLGIAGYLFLIGEMTYSGWRKTSDMGSLDGHGGEVFIGPWFATMFPH
jgi:chlorophyll synthase